MSEQVFSTQAAPGAYNHAVDEKEHTVEQWKGTSLPCISVVIM